MAGQVVRRRTEHVVAGPVPQILEEIVDVAMSVPRVVEQLNRGAHRTLPMCQCPRFGRETVEMVRLVPQERVQQQTDGHIEGVPLPQIVEEIVEVVRRAPHQHVQQQTDEFFCGFSSSSNFRKRPLR